MKKRFSLLGIIAGVLIGVCSIFVACEDELNSVVTYAGKVVYKGSTTPFPNLMVQVTDGTNIHCQGFTDDAGMFSLKVKVNEIDGSYDLLVGDSTCVPKRVHLTGFGQAEVDLGVIEVEGPQKPIVETLPIRSYKVGTAVSGGNITNGGRVFISARGVCWSSKEQYPTLENCGNQCTTDGTGDGKFVSNIENLKLGTTYYLRAYATNRIGTGYGEPLSFTVEDGLAQVITDSVYEVYADRARCASYVVSDGGFDILERGVCWSTIPEPTINDAHEKANADTGRYVCLLRDLALSTPYYVRAYVRNETDITYGNELQFISANGLPEVVTGAYTARATTVTINGEVKNNGGYPVLERGICYSTTNMSPSSSDEVITCGAGNGAFTATITDLTPGKTYYFRAYAKNQNGYNYGDSQSVTTGTGVPTVVIKIASVTATTASTIVNVTNSNGANLESCGIYWSQSTNPATQGERVVAGGLQLNTEYICNISGLDPKKTYYICAFAKTDIAENYSSVVNFTTKAGEPEVTTITPAISTGTNYLEISGSASTTSDAPILRQGICWNTISNPSIDDNVVEASVSVNPFSCRIDGLQSGTTYYCRAFAENKFGRSYGESKPFTTNYDPTTLTGYVYDQDGNPISGATVMGYDVSGYSGTTDNNGYYSITLGSKMSGHYQFRAYATNYDDQIKDVTLTRGQQNQLDFTITLTNKFAVDFGTGLYQNPGTTWEMYFECNQTHLPGQTTTRNVRIKNYRSVPVAWSITNIPSTGITFSKSSGNITALGEVSITVTFRYPSTSSYMVSLPGCSSGSKTYIWNWDAAYGGYYINNGSAIQSACNACCWQNPIIMVDNYTEAFTLLFNQGLVWN